MDKVRFLVAFSIICCLSFLFVFVNCDYNFIAGNSKNLSTFSNTEETLLWKDEYLTIDNKTKGWWSGNRKDGSRPVGGETSLNLKAYNTYFIGKDEKVIYLTFDEGQNDTYLNEIVDVLNANEVKATFFLCKGYLEGNPDIIKKLESTGHSVGNHTSHHETMSTYANKNSFSTFLKEIREVEESYFKITGKEMDKVYREPRGEWSFRSLAIVQDLGYKSFFWSADYLDWDQEYTKEYALRELKKRVHNGAIYLIHPKCRGNYEAMDTFIKDMKQQGYSFDLVKNISSL